MSRPTVLWTIVLFFAASLVFGGLRRLTDGEPAGVVIGVQLAALALVVGAVWLFYRRTR
jgi:lipopolysaccharide export LptBFGC system permease protein LptF